MNTAAILGRLRTVATLAMIDACTIERRTAGPIDENTGTYPPVTEAVYTGPCRVYPAPSTTGDIAGAVIDTSRPMVTIPWTLAAVVRPDDTITITAGPCAGWELSVFDEIASTVGTARRYTCERREP